MFLNRALTVTLHTTYCSIVKGNRSLAPVKHHRHNHSQRPAGSFHQHITNEANQVTIAKIMHFLVMPYCVFVELVSETVCLRSDSGDI